MDTDSLTSVSAERPHGADATISGALLKKLATDFARDPGTGTGMIRKLFEAAPSQFTRAAVEALLDLEAGEAPAGMKFIAEVLFAQPDCLATICNPAEFSVEQSRQAVKRLKALNSSTDVRLSRLLAMLPAHSEAEAQFIMRVLEVLDDGKFPADALPVLRDLARCRDDRVRCKAVLLMGRIPRNPQWAGETRGTEGHAKANALEALWGFRTAAACDEFRKALSDASHRVVANGAVGLYLAGEVESFPVLLQLAEREEPAFRAAAAWAMGRTEDPRFQRKIAQMLEDPIPIVRQAAFRGLGNVRLKVRRLKSGQAFEVKIEQCEAKGADQNLQVAVSRGGEQVSGLTPREFVIFDGEELVKQFSVEAHEGGYRISYPCSEAALASPRSVRVQIFGESGAGEASFEGASGASS